MSLPLDKKNWPGTQTPTYTDDRNAKPIPQPPCDLPSQHQFEDSQEYIQVTRDQWGNETPQDWSNHREGTSGMGASGDRQFASNKADLQSTGEGNNMGLNEIPYGTGAAFDRASTVYIAVDRADRGKDE